MRADVDNVYSHIRHGPILDVGGGLRPFPFADTVFDLQGGDVSGDMCEPWPFNDNSFGFIVCSQTLEDIRDPIGACKEMQRVGKAGYIEVPSWKLELSTGHDEMTFVGHSLGRGIGYPHHRWIVLQEEDGLVFVQKFPYPYFLPELFSSPNIQSEKELYIGLFWEDVFPVREEFLISPKEVETWYRNLGVLR